VTPAATSTAVAPALSRGGALAKKVDVPLLAAFFFWYLGNYYYNITNKLALKAAGGKAGFPMTISSLQLGVGCLYALFMWVAPDGRAKPTVTVADITAMLPVAFCAMGAHSASVFALVLVPLVSDRLSRPLSPHLPLSSASSSTESRSARLR